MVFAVFFRFVSTTFASFSIWSSLSIGMVRLVVSPSAVLRTPFMVSVLYAKYLTVSV